MLLSAGELLAMVVFRLLLRGEEDDEEVVFRRLKPAASPVLPPLPVDETNVSAR